MFSDLNENADVDEDLPEELSIYHPDAEVDGEGNVTVYHRTDGKFIPSLPIPSHESL